jgi:hypothetical protein
MAKRSGYIVLCFLILWLPLPVIVIWTKFEMFDKKHFELYLNIQAAVFCFTTLSATANPIIYGMAIRTFRNAFKRLVKKHWKISI